MTSMSSFSVQARGVEMIQGSKSTTIGQCNNICIRETWHRFERSSKMLWCSSLKLRYTELRDYLLDANITIKWNISADYGTSHLYSSETFATDAHLRRGHDQNRCVPATEMDPSLLSRWFCYHNFLLLSWLWFCSSHKSIEVWSRKKVAK